jgi:hypothetical protein
MREFLKQAFPDKKPRTHTRSPEALWRLPHFQEESVSLSLSSAAADIKKTHCQLFLKNKNAVDIL